MINAPNKNRKITHNRDPKPSVLKLLGIDQQFRVEVGPPDASLLVWVIQPENNENLINSQPRGTILVIHGYRGQMIWTLDTAKALAEAGYRAILVDLRGHGRSSGKWISYGVVESRDLSQVIDDLEKRDLITGKLGAWGISMGAATVIQLTAADSRIKSTVAVAPFTCMRNIVPIFVRKFLPFNRWIVSDRQIQKTIDTAAAKANFDPDDADTINAINNTDTPILIIHGKTDELVPVEHGRLIHAAAPLHSKLIEMDNTGHISANVDRDNEISRQTVSWFDQYLVDTQ